MYTNSCAEGRFIVLSLVATPSCLRASGHDDSFVLSPFVDARSSHPWINVLSPRLSATSLQNGVPYFGRVNLQTAVAGCNILFCFSVPAVYFEYGHLGVERRWEHGVTSANMWSNLDGTLFTRPCRFFVAVWFVLERFHLHAFGFLFCFKTLSGKRSSRNPLSRFTLIWWMAGLRNESGLSNAAGCCIISFFEWTCYRHLFDFWLVSVFGPVSMRDLWKTCAVRWRISRYLSSGELKKLKRKKRWAGWDRFYRRETSWDLNWRLMVWVLVEAMKGDDFEAALGVPCSAGFSCMCFL